MKKIACIIVTYNRKTLLCNCLEAVIGQDYRPSVVYIVDNASTDGTKDALVKSFSLDLSKNTFARNNIEFKYIGLKENIGGAGGFYTGIKTAYETNEYDGFWVMDDDGVPDKQCLHKLVEHLDEYDYIAPEVIDINDHSRMAFEYCGERESFESKAHNNIIKGIACPFNGILYSKRLVAKIGFPKKEMFIWGDEENYNARAVKAGFAPITVVGAKHYHPSNRVQTAKSLFGQIDVAPQMWRCYCRYRNAIYNHKEEMSIFGLTYVFINHVYYYLIKKHSLKWTKCYINAFIAGLKGDFTGLNKYMRKA